MGKPIEPGEKVVGRITGAMGRWGTRQVVGTLISRPKDRQESYVVRDRYGQDWNCESVRRY